MDSADAIHKLARRSRQASLTLKSLSTRDKRRALSALHSELQSRRDSILQANTQDVTSAADREDYQQSLLRRLQLSSKKFDRILAGVLAVSKLEDPVAKTLSTTQLDEGLVLKKVACPIGVVCVIFEARPEVVIDISCLAIMSSNAVILKGGKEAERTNRILGECVRNALKKVDICQDTVQLVETREDINKLLRCDEYVDLVIPRGSNSLVRFIKNNTRIPVMGHADGLCTVYVDKKAKVDMACDIVVDAKAQYPAVCNAAETLLVHKEALKLLPNLVAALTKAKVELRCDPRSYEIAKAVERARCTHAIGEDFDTEFLDLIMAVKVVENIEEAVDHINEHGSGHTDAIITEDEGAARLFLSRVDSAGVYHNASTRFADGYRYGLGAEVGVSTNRTHARGPVGLEGLLIYKYELAGKGHTVAPYANGERQFLHRGL